MQKTLMILGMHRSGTSLVTQWLHRCGLNVGDQLLAASIGNAEGHYEDEEFLALHQEWLIKRNLTHTGLIAENMAPLTTEEKQQLKTLIAQKDAASNQWGWKEPRTCLWLPVYREYLPHAFSLIVLRNFNDTVNSLVMREYRMVDKIFSQKIKAKKGLSWLKWNYLKRKRPGFFFKKHAEEYLLIWVHYYEQIVEHFNALSPEKYLFVSYENLLVDDQKIYEHLVAQWGFSLQPVPFKNIFKKELLSNTRKISNYVENKTLLKRAQQLELLCLKLSQKAMSPVA